LDNNSYEMIRDYYNKQQLFLDYSNLNTSNKHELTVFSTDRDFPVKSIISKLAGKYFGDFRFIGHYYTNGKGRLEWIHAEDHSKILISSITASKIEIMAYNVSKGAINKFLHILQQFLLDCKILVNFNDTPTSLAN